MQGELQPSPEARQVADGQEAILPAPVLPLVDSAPPRERRPADSERGVAYRYCTNLPMPPNMDALIAAGIITATVYAVHSTNRGYDGLPREMLWLPAVPFALAWYSASPPYRSVGGTWPGHRTRRWSPGAAGSARCARLGRATSPIGGTSAGATGRSGNPDCPRTPDSASSI